MLKLSSIFFYFSKAFTFTVVPCQVTWAIMLLHRNLSSASCRSFAGRMLMLLLSMILSISMCLCLPRALLPSIFPVMLRCSILCFLVTCPKNFNCLLLISLSSVLPVFACCSTSMFVFLAVHGILSILRNTHISIASILSLAPLPKVQVSHPYVKVDHMYVRTAFNLIGMLICKLHSNTFIFKKLRFAMAILFFISVMHLPSAVISLLLVN